MVYPISSSPFPCFQFSVTNPETMPVMTRKATALDLEQKLRTALQELKDSKLLCQQLLQEREDSEEEVNVVNNKNSSLKRELVDLHQEYLNVVNERDQLRVVTDGFSNCSNLYEEALCKIRDLEDELIHANVNLLSLKKEKDHTQAIETDHLYNELVNTNCNPHSIITIDLTEDSLLKHNYSHKISKNKIKKYARLNKIIKKCNKYKKQQKHYSKNIQLRKERVSLINRLNNYQIKLEDSINIYEIDTQRLQSEIQALNMSLKSLYNKYECSKNQIKEHILATNELVDKVDSLTLSNTQCTCRSEPSLDALQPEASEDPSQAVSALDCIINQDIIPRITLHESQVVQPDIGNFAQPNCHDCNHSVMFSDSIGRGLGKLISNNLSYCTQNYCMPGSTYKQVMASVAKTVCDPNTTITICVGNSSKIKKEDITDCVSELLKLNCSKIILCAFPYFENLCNRKNNYIHMLNRHVHFLVGHYSDKLIYFDINTSVDKLRSTRGKVYLPIRCRHKIARLLAFSIHSDICSMSKFSYIINTATISNNTNEQVTLNKYSISAINVYKHCTEEDPCVTVENSQLGSISNRVLLSGGGTGVSGPTPDININLN